MRIGDVFDQDIARRIEEVVKVDLADDDVVASELSEYVVTERILDSMRTVVEAYQETILTPSGLTNLWVSGFFGSGKSSFAKVLGLLLENRVVAGRRVADWFFSRCDDMTLKALLNTSWSQAPACTVLMDLASSHDVINESEGIVAPVYRAVLARLGYAQTPKLAALEFELETQRRLEAFERAFADVNGREWGSSRDNVLSVNLASKALHHLDPETFPSADSWGRSVQVPALDANWFAKRALELLERRGGGAKRLVLVVDEVGQYVARSIPRIVAMQGLAEACQKRQGRLWLIATGQERLEAVVEGLEGRLVETQRMKDRFPLRVDLVPSDIEEVVSRRVLGKNERGSRAIREVLQPYRQKLAANTRLVSETRAAEPGEEELVRLYPLLPYQVQLLIDAVSTRRSQVLASAPMGGSNRTIIKHAQQLVTSAKVGLREGEVGALVTLDRSYDLLEENIPTSWRAEVEQVAAKYGASSTETQVIKAVTLAHDVRSLHLTAHNLAVLLHPHVAAESHVPEVAAALAHLVADDRLRESDRGYQLQSVEQKLWEQERRNIDLGPGDEIRLRKRLLAKALSSLTIAHGRTFAIGVAVEGEQMVDGNPTIELISTEDASQRERLRGVSRESANATRVLWLFKQDEDTWTALRELHRSERMIERHDVASKSTTDIQLLADERNRRTDAERTATERLTRDLGGGEVLFRGESHPVPAVADSRVAAQTIVRDRLPDIYPYLDRFAAAIDAKGVMLVLRADDLGTLPAPLGEDGIGLTRVEQGRVELAIDSDPLAAFVAEVKRRNDFGQAPTGQALERHFGNPPYGAPVVVVQALVAATLRAGLVEIVHQGQPIVSPADRRLDNVFRTLPGFRQVEVRPPHDRGPDIRVRTRLASKLQEYTGEPQSPALAELAGRLRSHFGEKREPAAVVDGTLRGAGLVVPTPVLRVLDLLARIHSEDDSEVVTTAAGRWEDLLEGVRIVEQLSTKLREDLGLLTGARDEAARDVHGLPQPAVEAHTRLVSLLRAADYVDRAGDIRTLTQQVAAARREATESMRAELNQRVEGAVAALSTRFASLDPDRLDEVLRPLSGLAAPEQAGLDQLESRMSRVEAETARARRLLEELDSDRGLVDLRVADLVDGPLAAVSDLERLVGSLREAVEQAWADGKRVRLV